MKTLMSELLDEIAALKADNQKLKDDLKTSRGQHAWATRKARDAENVARVLQEENARLRGSGERTEAIPDPQPATAEPESSIFALQYAELMRAHRLINALFRESNGELAAVGNRMLRMVADMCEAVEGPRKGRRAA